MSYGLRLPLRGSSSPHAPRSEPPKGETIIVSMDDTASARSSRKGPKRPTLAEVAKQAGVSVSAASFVLSGRTDQRIAADTWARVEKAADSLGYRPNTVAKTLFTGKSGTVAFVSEFVASTPYATRAIAGALQEALKRDTLLFVAETLGQADLERRLLHGLIDRRVDAFLYAAMFTREVTVPEALRDTELVLLNCTSPDVSVASVLPDEVAAGRTAARTLLQAGHRDSIFYLGAPVERYTLAGVPQWQGRLGLAIEQRLRGVKQELDSARVALARAVELDDWEPDYGRAAVEQLLDSGEQPRALICANDRVAVGAYQALLERSLRVPEDVSIVSFDDSELAHVVRPGLTSIALPHEEMGRRAIELLLSGGADPVEHLVPMALVERGSIAPPTRR